MGLHIAATDSCLEVRGGGAGNALSLDGVDYGPCLALLVIEDLRVIFSIFGGGAELVVEVLVDEDVVEDDSPFT